MSNLKGGAVLVVVLIVAAAVLGGFIFLKFKNVSDNPSKTISLNSEPSPNAQNSQDQAASPSSQTIEDAANLIGHTNPDYKYSFKYPKTIADKEIFFVSKASSEEMTDIKPPLPIDAAPKHIYIGVIDNPKKLSLKEYIDGIFTEKNTIPPGGGTMISYSDQPELMASIIRKPTKIDNVDAEILIGLPSANGQYEVIAPLGSDKFISFILTPYIHDALSSEDKKWVEAFERLLSSFKFNR